MIFSHVFKMFANINDQSYIVNDNNLTATITYDVNSEKIEIFPTVEYNNKTYEVVFPDDCSELFKDNKYLKTFILHKLLHKTTNITNMSEMFCRCISLEVIDLSNLDTSNVTSINKIFSGCNSIDKLDLSYLNMISLKTMGGAFCNMEYLKRLDLFTLNTKTPIDTTLLLYNCKRLRMLNLNNIENMNYIINRIDTTRLTITNNVKNSYCYDINCNNSCVK